MIDKTVLVDLVAVKNLFFFGAASDFFKIYNSTHTQNFYNITSLEDYFDHWWEFAIVPKP